MNIDSDKTYNCILNIDIVEFLETAPNIYPHFSASRCILVASIELRRILSNPFLLKHYLNTSPSP